MTQDQRLNIQSNLDKAISDYDYDKIMEIAASHEYAIYYIITKLFESNEQIAHIKNILK